MAAGVLTGARIAGTVVGALAITRRVAPFRVDLEAERASRAEAAGL